MPGDHFIKIEFLWKFIIKPHPLTVAEINYFFHNPLAYYRGHYLLDTLLSSDNVPLVHRGVDIWVDR